MRTHEEILNDLDEIEGALSIATIENAPTEIIKTLTDASKKLNREYTSADTAHDVSMGRY